MDRLSQIPEYYSNFESEILSESHLVEIGEYDFKASFFREEREEDSAALEGSHTFAESLSSSDYFDQEIFSESASLAIMADDSANDGIVDNMLEKQINDLDSQTFDILHADLLAFANSLLAESAPDSIEGDGPSLNSNPKSTVVRVLSSDSSIDEGPTSASELAASEGLLSSTGSSIDEGPFSAAIVSDSSASSEPTELVTSVPSQPVQESSIAIPSSDSSFSFPPSDPNAIYHAGPEGAASFNPSTNSQE